MKLVKKIIYTLCLVVLTACQAGDREAYMTDVSEAFIKPEQSILNMTVDRKKLDETVTSIIQRVHKGFGDTYEKWSLRGGALYVTAMGPRRMTSTTIRSPREFIKYYNDARQGSPLELPRDIEVSFGQNKMGRFFYATHELKTPKPITCVVFAQAVDGSNMAGSYIRNGEGSEAQLSGEKCEAGSGSAVVNTLKQTYLPILESMSLKIM